MTDTIYILKNVEKLPPKPMYVDEQIVDALANLTYKQRKQAWVLGRDTSTLGYVSDEPPKYPGVPIKDFVFWLFNYYNYHANYTFTHPATVGRELAISKTRGKLYKDKDKWATSKETIEDLKSKVRKYFTIKENEENERTEVINSDYHFDCGGKATLELEVTKEIIKHIKGKKRAMIKSEDLYNHLESTKSSKKVSQLKEIYNGSEKVYIVAIKDNNSGIYYNLDNNDLETYLRNIKDSSITLIISESEDLSNVKIEIKETTPKIYQENKSNIDGITSGADRASLQFMEFDGTDRDPVFYVHNMATALPAALSSTAGVANGWEERNDPSTGRAYYYNAGPPIKSVWERPTEMRRRRPQPLDGDERVLRPSVSEIYTTLNEDNCYLNSSINDSPYTWRIIKISEDPPHDLTDTSPGAQSRRRKENVDTNPNIIFSKYLNNCVNELNKKDGARIRPRTRRRAEVEKDEEKGSG